MKIKRIIVGQLEENCYIISENNKCLIIDPGDEPNKIISNVSGCVTGILITHYHPDHIGALETLKRKYKCDVNNFKNPFFKFVEIPTPGHTSDSLTFYFKEQKTMFTGDFIFNGTIGRTDLPTGSNIKMIKSLDKIKKFSNDITIYPGHGPKTTLEAEKKHFNTY